MPKLFAGAPGKKKFWHAWVNGSELTVRFGKLGTTGQEQTKSFASNDAAAKELAKLLKQKLAKGYADAARHITVDPSGLEMHELFDLPLPTPQDDASTTTVTVDCKALALEPAAPADEIVSSALLHDYVALLCKNGSAVRLELYSRDGKAWKLAHTIKCARHDRLFSFARGRALIVGWEKKDESWNGKSWPTTHYLGLDGGVRLLGKGPDVYYFFEKDDRSFYCTHDMSLMEITNIDAALAKVARDGVPESL